jgi:hypothetical protein
MSIADTKLWKKMFERKRESTHVDSLKDIEAIEDFLEDLNADVKVLLKEVRQLKELEEERRVAKSGVLHVNLETQAGVFDRLLERYGFFQEDVDINGLRLQRVAKMYLKQCQKMGLTDLVFEKKQDEKWKFHW